MLGLANSVDPDQMPQSISDHFPSSETIDPPALSARLLNILNVLCINAFKTGSSLEGKTLLQRLANLFL